MSVDFERRAAFLEEMGLGPQWVRRNVSRVEAEADAESPQAVPSAVLDAADMTDAAALAPAPGQTPASESATSAQDVEATLLASPPNMQSAWSDEPMAPAAVPASLASVANDVAAMGWQELEQAVSGCTRCRLCDGRNRTVFGVGDRKARWLFIGEGPGREEDLRGEPFVGPAGQLLDNMLAALKLARGQNAYIANVIKCRPTDEGGKDRRPSAQESASCLPYLERQIELIQPDVIVALGKTAAVSLLGLDPETAVSSLRGKVHRHKGRPLVVTYHPAYLLRTPADKKKTWADLCLAMSEYTKVGVAV